MKECKICGREHRRGIGGTTMGMILGLVKWGGTRYNALDAYHRLTREMHDEEIESIDKFRGHHMEPDIAEWYFEETGRRGRAWPGGWCEHPDYPAFVGHPDFEIFGDEDAPEAVRDSGILEVKAPRSGTFTRVYEQGLRQSEIVQLQTYLAVTRRSWGAFAFGNLEHEAGPMLPVVVESDPTLADFILEIGQRFWDSHVATRTPPDPDEWKLWEDPDMPTVMETTGEVKKVEDDPELADMAQGVIEAKRLKKEAETMYDERKNALQAYIEDRFDTDRILVPGVAKLTIVRNAGRSTFSRRALEGHRPIDRDKLYNWLLTEEGGWRTGALAETICDELELDLDEFERQGSPYSYLLPTAKT